MDPQNSPSNGTDTAQIAQLIANRIGSQDWRAAWNNPQNTTTRHFVVDNLLPGELALRTYNAFPKSQTQWNSLDTFRERKKTFAKLEAVDPIIAAVTDAFHTPAVLEAVHSVTQLDGLEADPSLYAGGISMMGKGDFLNPHIDNSHDGARKRYRRLNLLYYISPDWQLGNGGNFELWNPAVTSPQVIQSAFNRLVVMETTRTSWHSVQPVTAEQPRCCVSNYYFSQRSPEERDYYHVTSFLGRPDQHGLRAYSRVDNALRQFVAVVTKHSRGKSASRY